jgi:hypothetical protein
MKGEPTVKTYSTNYLATAFEIDRATAVRALKDVSADQEQTRGRPTFKISTFARALELHHLKNMSSNDGIVEGTSDSSNLIAARTRVTLANAVSRERSNAIASGEFESIKKMGDMLEAWFHVFRERSLATPGKCADSLTPFTPKDRTAIYEILYREFHDMLLDLSSEVFMSNMLAKRLAVVADTANTKSEAAAPAPLPDDGADDAGI